MKAVDILNKYIKFFENRGHVRIENSSLVPLNDPTTLFTSSGMQPLIPFLLGEPHPSGKRLVNAQNSFRAQDIDEIGDNRHTTFFRMLGNWSLGDYFKKEQIPWFFQFLTDKKEGLGLDPQRLFVTVFAGNDSIPKDEESISIWIDEFKKAGIDAKLSERIFAYDVTKNWWSRAGTPDKMPKGEPGGPDSEVFYDFGEDLKSHENSQFKDLVCHVNCDCGRYMEIGNSVFMQFIKNDSGFTELPQKNVDFGGGLERLVAATEQKQDIFETSLFAPIISSISAVTGKPYKGNEQTMRIILDHFVGGVFICSNGVKPANKEQGYILRRLIRRGLDNFYLLDGSDIAPIIEAVIDQYKDTDPYLVENFEDIKYSILEEEATYQKALSGGKKMIEKEIAKLSDEVKVGDELMGVTLISADIAFKAITSFGLGPTQLKSLGYTFDDQELAQKIKEHQDLSRQGAKQKFAGGLADHSDLTVKGHTATHLMHQALRDVLGKSVHQTGSNITSDRVRFDFTFDRKVTQEELNKVTEIVRQKVKENLIVHFEMMPIQKARDIGAIGLFNDKYAKDVKIYFVGGPNESFGRRNDAYSIEFCGGPHVENTAVIKTFDILKEEGVARGVRRIYAKVT